ncbi:ribosome-binding factor A [Rickettsiaceae bacterium]|nr:ribosome-binding factor A [Rickettsiaceae bacterium]
MSKSKKNFKFKIREKEQSQRQLQISRLINVSLAECFSRCAKLSPILVPCPLTITKVNISPDLRIVNCFFLPFNTEYSSDQILDALEESKYIIRNYITRKVDLKYSPEIRFYCDVAFERDEI